VPSRTGAAPDGCYTPRTMGYAALLVAIFLLCIVGTVLLIVYFYWGPKGPPGRQ